MNKFRSYTNTSLVSLAFVTDVHRTSNETIQEMKDEMLRRMGMRGEECVVCKNPGVYVKHCTYCGDDQKG